MMQENTIPSLIILSIGSDGKVQCTDQNGKLLPLLSHGESLACIFIPVLMVEQQLAYKDYALYIFENEEELSIKIGTIRQDEDDAILLIGTGEHREIYFIEDKTLVSRIPIPFVCEAYLDLINGLEVSPEGKAASSDLYSLNKIIKLLRDTGNRGNEAEISGTRIGLNVFSRDFSPCNAVVARRKKDNQFVLHHSASASMDRSRRGVDLFFEGIAKGEGFTFAAVMQNPKVKKNRLKAPMLAAQLAIQLKDQNVDRINIPEGYGAIACVNGDTIIMTQELRFFSGELDKQPTSHFKTKTEEAVRFIELASESLSLFETTRELRAQFQKEKDNPTMTDVYGGLLGQLSLFSSTRKNPPDDERKSKCSLM